MLKQKFSNYMNSPLTWKRYWKTCGIAYAISVAISVLVVIGIRVYDKLDDWRFLRRLQKEVNQKEEP